MRPLLTRRLLKDWRLWLAVAVLGYTAAGFLLVPWLLRDQALGYLREERGLTAELGQVSFNPYLFRLRLQGFTVRAPDGAPLVALRDGLADFDPSWLLRGVWRIKTLRLAGPAVELERHADGTWNLAALLPPAAREDPEDQSAAMPRVSVGEITVGEGRLGYAEPDRQPAFRQELGPIEFHATTLSTLPDERGDYRLTLGIAGGELTLSGAAGLAPLAVDARVATRNVSLLPAAEYLGPQLPLRVAAGTAGLAAEVAVEPGPKVRVQGLTAEVAGLKLVTPAGEPVLELPRLALSGGALTWPEQRLDMAAITLTGARLSTWLERGQPFSLAQLAAPRDDQQPGTGAAATEPQTAAASPPPQANPWQIALQELRFEQAEIAFHDRTLAEPAIQRLQIETLNLSDISTAPDARIGVDGTLRLNAAGNIAVKGRLTPSPLAAELEFALAGLPLAPATPYVQRELHSAITEGTLGGQLALRHTEAAGTELSGDLAVAELAMDDLVRERPWLRWNSLDIARLELQLRPESRLHIGEIRLARPWLDVTVRKDGSNTVGRMRAAAPAAASAPEAPKPAVTATEDPAPSAAPLAVTVDEFRVVDGALKFRDFSLPLPFAVQTHSLNGALRHFSNREDARVDLKLEGAIDRYGEARIVARIQPAAPREFTNFELHFDNVDFRSVTPYAAKFAGYAIESGTLRLDLAYRIENQRLRGDNRVLLKQLKLGEQIESPGATKLPLHLAVALLKDSRGNINLDLPVRGDLSDPKVSVGRLVWKAFANVITKAATAPFAALGRLVGAGEGELEAIGFDPGAAALTPSQRQVVDRLAGALAQRPGIAVAFGGCTAEAADGAALRAAKLRTVLADLGADTGDAEDEREALEEAFTDTFSDADWEALEETHPEAPEALAEAARERLVGAQPLNAGELGSLAQARRRAVLGYLIDQAKVPAEQALGADSTSGKVAEGRVQCRLESRALTPRS